MQISDYVCGVKVSVGEPSKNHLRIEAKHDKIISTMEMSFMQWQEFKAKIDRIGLLQRVY
jgi:hypothetical protein